MAADDEPERSLFVRLRDCELRRGRGEVKSRPPCKSRDLWQGGMQGKSSDAQKSSEPAAAGKVTSEIDESSKKKHSADQGARQTDDNMIKDSQCQPDSDCLQPDNREECPDQKIDPSDKSLRHYHIKMQNPEAPPCCEHIQTRRVYFPNTRKMQTDNCPSRASGRCSACAASFEAESPENHYQ